LAQLLGLFWTIIHDDQPGDESTKFLLWDRECSELIGQLAYAINKLKIEVCFCIQE